MRHVPEDPCQRATDELTPEVVRGLVRELGTAAVRVRREVLDKLAGGVELVVLADLAGSALEQLDRVALELSACSPGGGTP